MGVVPLGVGKGEEGKQVWEVWVVAWPIRGLPRVMILGQGMTTV